MFSERILNVGESFISVWYQEPWLIHNVFDTLSTTVLVQHVAGGYSVKCLSFNQLVLVVFSLSYILSGS